MFVGLDRNRSIAWSTALGWL